MLPLDKGTRNLLPSCDGDRADAVLSEAAFVGSFAPAAFPPMATPPVMQPAVDLPPVERVFDDEPATMPIKGFVSPLAAHDGSGAPGEEAGSLHLVPISIAENLPAPASTLHRAAEAHGQQDARRDPDGDGVEHPAGDIDGEITGLDDGHSIGVTQIALVDQDAGIIVSGYVGEVVARVHIDQDLMMDQDVDIALTIDGDGHFVVLIDQDTRIDQEIEIDLKIYDIDGVLYVDLLLRDSIEVEQDTSIDMAIGDGPPGGTVDVNQTIAMDQDVDIDIDIDIEDELEERYLIEVNVDIVQLADVDQDAVVDIRQTNGEIDMTIDAVQMASIDQQTLVQADFALI